MAGHQHRSAAVQALGNYPTSLTHDVLERFASGSESLVASFAQQVIAKQNQ